MLLDELNVLLLEEISKHRVPDITYPLEVLLAEVANRVMASRSAADEDPEIIRPVVDEALVRGINNWPPAPYGERTSPFSHLALVAKYAILDYQVRRKYWIGELMKEGNAKAI